jgi:predicted  nucleic acid-binding Zn-ribbon protein
MIKFSVQAEADELKRLRAELPEAVKAAASKSKAAEASVVRIQKRIKEIEGE